MLMYFKKGGEIIIDAHVFRHSHWVYPIGPLLTKIKRKYNENKK